jgi:hypothetical protein
VSDPRRGSTSAGRGAASAAGALFLSGLAQLEGRVPSAPCSRVGTAASAGRKPCVNPKPLSSSAAFRHNSEVGREPRAASARAATHEHGVFEERGAHGDSCEVCWMRAARSEEQSRDERPCLARRLHVGPDPLSLKQLIQLYSAPLGAFLARLGFSGRAPCSSSWTSAYGSCSCSSSWTVRRLAMWRSGSGSGRACRSPSRSRARCWPSAQTDRHRRRASAVRAKTSRASRARDRTAGRIAVRPRAAARVRRALVSVRSSVLSPSASRDPSLRIRAWSG